MRLLRLLKIASVASRFGLDEMVLEHEPSGRLVRIANALQFWRNLSAPRAERLRLALESLYPEIGRKFGGRDHSTVIHAVRLIEDLRTRDADMDGDVRSLLRQLES